MQGDLSNCKMSGTTNGKRQTAIQTANSKRQTPSGYVGKINSVRYMTDALANNIAGFSSIKRFQLPSSTYNVKVSPKACLDQLRKTLSKRIWLSVTSPSRSNQLPLTNILQNTTVSNFSIKFAKILRKDVVTSKLNSKIRLPRKDWKRVVSQ